VKVVLLCSDSPNQIALANLLHQEFGVAQIIIWAPKPLTRAKRVRLFSRIMRFTLGFFNIPYRRAWFGMLQHYSKTFSKFPSVPLLKTTDINNQEVARLIRNFEDTLFLVSGTNLLSQSLLTLIHNNSKMINLHTGISPYVKGGPNCTNWCLANNRLARIGNTVLWIDQGIDSGNLITTEQTNLEGITSLLELHIRVMDHAHDLYLRVVTRILSGQRVPSIKQSEYDERNLFLTKNWTVRMRIKGLVNFVIRFKVRRDALEFSEDIVLVNLLATD
jgi:methionyl-tRNA formyltransferase